MGNHKGPAFAGLFFALSFALPAAPRLSRSQQEYFRRFIEVFTPAVLKRHGVHGGNYRWDAKNRDCAGLVRYVFWEAMQRHDERFRAHYRELHALAIAEPPGNFAAVQGAWIESNLTAPQLITRSRPLGRALPHKALKTGDLLYFRSDELKIRHVMLVLRAGATPYLIYHTGDQRDELRIRTLSDMLSLDENHWHPDTQNPVFQGYFRPEFLD